jgi:hypothetical protein
MNNGRIKQFINELNVNISSNYPVIAEIFNSEYGYPTLDPLRDEICKCIICDLHQASITLTNHFLEASLKKCLVIKYSIDNKNDALKPKDAFNEGIAKYDKCTLSETINTACSKGLISKEQKKKLNKFRENYRNPYAHAESAKIFKDTTVRGKSISVKKNENPVDFLKRIVKSPMEEIPVKNLLPIQGIAQVELAKNTSIPYFCEVDKIIRNILANLRSKES